MAKEINVSEDGNKITITNEGKDGSLYETIIYLKDKEQEKSQEEGE